MDFQVLGHVAAPRLYRRHFIHPLCSHGLKSPRLFAFGFASFRRHVCLLSFPRTCTLGLSTFGFAPFQAPCLLLRCNVMLNLFNFVQFAHAWHSSSKLASALAQSQISASHCEPLLNPFPRWDPETSSGWRCMGGYGGLEALSPRMRCRSASSQTPFSILRFCFHGLKSPRLFAFGFASFRRLVFVHHVRRLGGFDLCIV